jgi:hypothetical protein
LSQDLSDLQNNSTTYQVAHYLQNAQNAQCGVSVERDLSDNSTVPGNIFRRRSLNAGKKSEKRPFLFRSVPLTLDRSGTNIVIFVENVDFCSVVFSARALDAN